MVILFDEAGEVVRTYALKLHQNRGPRQNRDGDKIDRPQPNRDRPKQRILTQAPKDRN